MMNEPSSSTTNANSSSGGGLGNLIALAHLATMTADGCGTTAGVVPSKNGHSPNKKASSTTTTMNRRVTASSPPPPSSRRPAKKRAVPAEFDLHSAGGSVNEAPMQLPSVAARLRGNIAKRAKLHPNQPSSHAQPSHHQQTPRHQQQQQRNKHQSAQSYRMKPTQPTFPTILLAMLSSSQNKEYISFLSDGKRFIIIDAAALERIVLPAHFGEGNSKVNAVPKLRQFYELLGIWGFETVKDPAFPDVNLYHHPNFRRGDWESCLKMKLPHHYPENAAAQDAKRTEKVRRAQMAKIEVQMQEVDREIKGREDNVDPTRGKTNGVHKTNPEPPASPRQDAVANEANVLSPPMTARSVTPPMNEIMEYSKLPKAVLLEKLAGLYRGSGGAKKDTKHLPQQLQESVVSSYKKLDGTSLPQTEMRQSASLGNRQDAMMGRFHPGVSSSSNNGMMMMNGTASLHMPLNQRRASLGATPSSTGVPLAFLGGGIGSNLMPARRMMGRTSLPFATPSSCFNRGHHTHPGAGVVHQPAPPQLNSASLPGSRSQPKPPSDEEVNSATRHIVSAAINALHPTRPTVSSKYRRHTVDGVPPNFSVDAARLDDMTGRFLERSIARLNSRPAPWRVAGRGGDRPSRQAVSTVRGMMTTTMQPRRQFGLSGGRGSGVDTQSLIASLDAEVEKQTQACLAARGLLQRKCIKKQGTQG